MKYKGYVISDIHIGAKDTSKLYEEYKSIFINTIKSDYDDLNFIVICGDYFDHKLYLNETNKLSNFFNFNSIAFIIPFHHNLIKTMRQMDILI